jgi:beta-lactamase regulating signal transducer with metallopeptidase domain
MNLIAYLLKANLGLVLFLAGYVFFYRQGTLFRLNRFYFLICSLAVLLLPLVDLKTFFEKPKLSQLAVIDLVPSVGYVHAQDPAEQEFWQSLSSTEVILLVGLLGMCIMFLRFLLQCVSLYWLKNKATEVPFLSSNWAKIVRARLYFLTNPISPFSFFNWIFVSPSLHTPKELDDIITHEQVHVSQWHSIDVLLAEVLVVVLWYNPLVWLWRSFLKQNLEFLTDQTLVSNGIDSKQYQYNLLKISALNSQFQIPT